MQFPLHLPCTSMGCLFVLDGVVCRRIEVANNRIVPRCMRIRWPRLLSRLYQEHECSSSKYSD